MAFSQLPVQAVSQGGVEQHLDQNGHGQQGNDQGLVQKGLALEGKQ